MKNRLSKEEWIKLVEDRAAHYFNQGIGGFDEHLEGSLIGCDYENRTVTFGFPTLSWQVNEKGRIHGGPIAGMFDTGLGIVANLLAGENETATTDMAVSYINGIEMGMELEMTVYVVKVGRSLIRTRGELRDRATKQLLAIGMGSFLPL